MMTPATQYSGTPAEACEICGHVATTRHPCRFERACSCWYGVPCNGTGAKYRGPNRTAALLSVTL